VKENHCVIIWVCPIANDLLGSLRNGGNQSYYLIRQAVTLSASRECDQAQQQKPRVHGYPLVTLYREIKNGWSSVSGPVLCQMHLGSVFPSNGTEEQQKITETYKKLRELYYTNVSWCCVLQSHKQFFVITVFQPQTNHSLSDPLRQPPLINIHAPLPHLPLWRHNGAKRVQMTFIMFGPQIEFSYLLSFD